MHAMKTYLKHTGTFFGLFAMVLSCARPSGLNNLDEDTGKDGSNLQGATPPQVIIQQRDAATLTGGCYTHYEENWQPPQGSIYPAGFMGQCQYETAGTLMKTCQELWDDPSLNTADATAAIIGGVLKNFKFPPPSSSAADLGPEPTPQDCANRRTADQIVHCTEKNRRAQEEYKERQNQAQTNKKQQRWQTAKSILGSSLNALGSELKSRFEQQAAQFKQLNRDRIEVAGTKATFLGGCAGPGTQELLQFCINYFDKAPVPCDSDDPSEEKPTEDDT